VSYIDRIAALKDLSLLWSASPHPFLCYLHF